MRRFIIFLIRKRLGLKKYEIFRFVNQKSNALYYFTGNAVIKYWRGQRTLSGVSINWLLDENCEIEIVDA